MKNKSIITWQCPECKDIVVSNDWESHLMNYCECGKNACDMEANYVRWIGCSVLDRRAKRHYLDELLKPEPVSTKKIKTNSRK